MSAQLMTLDGEELLLISFADVTELKEAEEATRRGEALLRGLITNLPAIMWIIDTNGIFTLSEGKGLELLGLRPGEVVGRSVFDEYHDYPAITDSVRRGLSGMENSHQVEVGGIVFQTWTTPMKNEKGAITGILGVAIDSTELVRTKQDAEEARTRAELYLDILTHDITNYNTAAMGYI